MSVNHFRELIVASICQEILLVNFAFGFRKLPFLLSVKATSSLLKMESVYCASLSLGHKLGRAV